MKIALLILLVGVCNAAMITNWDEFDKLLENAELEFADVDKLAHGELEFADAEGEFVEKEQEYDDAEEQFANEQEYDDTEEQFADEETNFIDDEQQVAAANKKVTDAQKYIASLGLNPGTVVQIDNDLVSIDTSGRVDSFNYSMNSNLVSQNVTRDNPITGKNETVAH